MMGPPARPLRILAEYLEPLERFRRLGVERAVIFFGSARLKPGVSDNPDGQDYYEAARRLAGLVARWTVERHRGSERFFLCTGAGPGIMEAASRGVHEVDPRLSIGLNISLPFEQGSNGFISPDLEFEFHYFFMRKFWFMNLAQGMVVFPGGFGTLDELFEVLTLVQTGKSRGMPVVLFGTKFWQSLVNFEQLVDLQLIDRSDLDLFLLTDSVEEAFAYLKSRLQAEPA